MESPTKLPQDALGEPEFSWDEYLEETGSSSVPPTAFSHVEYSLESGFKVGMKLEVPNPDDPTNYWLASVIMTCGPLLSLRYVGYGDDRSADFWFRVKSGEFHPVGWSSANGKKLWPPKGVLEKHEDVDALLAEVLKNVESIPASLSEDDAGIIPIDRIQCQMKVEVTEELNPNNVWIATIEQNVGGRLLLRYIGSKSEKPEEFWLFYLSDRIDRLNSAPQRKLKYSVPESIKSQHTKEEWDKLLKLTLKNAEHTLSAKVLEPKLPLEKHAYKEGMKLEAVDPETYEDLCPATVCKVINEFHFLVSIDDFCKDKKKRILCCNSNSFFIFPIHWAQENGLKLKPPQGYEQEGEFIWAEYLLYCVAEAAPSDIFPMNFMNTGFEVGMKLEAASPFNPYKIYVATVEKILEPLMWIRFDVNMLFQKTMMTSINSMDLFPVGWCHSNVYPLHFPKQARKAKTSNKENKATEKSNEGATHKEQGKSWCPKIYFNHRCFSGPLLSKSRLAELPQAIGPGPVNLVMTEVLTRLINIAYKSSQVLQELRGRASADMQQHIIKAKYKGKVYRGPVEFVCNSEEVEEFCRKTCIKLECCPYLFGPTRIENVCPDNCHTQTKTKFGYNFVKKQKKLGRPPLTDATDNGEVVKRGPGRRKKRKHWRFLRAAAATPEEKKPKLEDEKVVKKHVPKYEIVTRGAKLPNFGLWHHLSPFHCRRGRPPKRPFVHRKVGRPVGTTKKQPPTSPKTEVVPEVTSVSTLESNPLHWSVDEVAKYLKKTECATLAPLLKEQEIDGQSFLMLNLSNVQELLRLKLEPALKFCYIIKHVKLEFFKHFANGESNS